MAKEEIKKETKTEELDKEQPKKKGKFFGDPLVILE